MKLRLPQCQAPLLALPQQRNHREEEEYIKHAPEYPRILHPNLFAQGNRVEAYREAEHVAAEIEDRANFRCLWFVALTGVGVNDSRSDLQTNASKTDSDCRANPMRVVLEAHALYDDAGRSEYQCREQCQ